MCLAAASASAQGSGDPHLTRKPNAVIDTEPLAISQDQALWTALAFEDPDKVRLLLDKGADPNQPEELSLMTPLMASETSAIAQALLDKGADPKARDRTGRTPLHYAVMMREARNIIPLLIGKGADANARATNGDTPLMVAVENYIDDKEATDKSAYEVTIRALVHLGADINAADTRDRTPLAVAASRNQPQLIRLLIELGADPAKPLGNGRTPLDYAREANAQDAIQVLAALTTKKRPAN